MTSVPSVLVIDNLTVKYRSEGPDVLTGIRANLTEGEHVAILGLNGSGKSTLLASIAGLMPFTGRIEVDGLTLSRSTIGEIRKRIGYLFTVPEDQILFPRVLDDVVFSLTQRGVRYPDAREQAGQMLDRLGILDLAEESPYELSHGQRLRVALAGALVVRPRLLLLDEPSSGLDPVARRMLIRHLRRADAAMLLATHDLQLAAAVCDRYFLLDRGRIVETGTDFTLPGQRWESASEP